MVLATAFSRPRRAWLTGSAGALITYGVFLAWDRALDVDPATGVETGPYQAWQVIGCAVVLTALAYAGGAAQQVLATSASLTVAFTTAWSVQAANTVTDGANLWPVGALFMVQGLSLWTAFIACLGRNRSRATQRP